MKQAFIFWPKTEKKVEQPEETKEPEKTETPVVPPTLKTDGLIIDISKHQGSINFDKLKGKVSLIIARASCGSDKDIKIDEYAKAMNERGIPFGVYCYSYAGTEAKAIDEAQKIVKYASPYKPLFYVVDAEEERLTNATIKVFAKELRRLGIEKIGCYVAHHRYKTYDYDSLRSLFNFTWIPRYGANNGTIAGATKPDYICDLWQYTSTGKVAGISGNVDMNVITGDGNGIEWFLEGYAGAAVPVEEPVQESTSDKQVKVVNGNVNVRTAPNTSGNIIGVAYNGAVLPYRGETASNGWLSVVFNGKNGWISGVYGRLV